MNRSAPTKAWFRPRRFGYGAAPVTWQGWLAVTAYAAAVILPALLILGPSAEPLDLLLVGLIWGPLTWAFIRWAKARTDGEWRFRWERENQP